MSIRRYRERYEHAKANAQHPRKKIANHPLKRLRRAQPAASREHISRRAEPLPLTDSAFPFAFPFPSIHGCTAQNTFTLELRMPRNSEVVSAQRTERVKEPAFHQHETQWLTAKEAAAHLRVKARTLLLWTRQGRVTGYALSGSRRHIWRYLRNDLDAALLGKTRAMLSSPSVLVTEGEQ